MPDSRKQGFHLIRNGKPEKCAIIIPSHPNSVVIYAAKELNYHLKKATGTELPVLVEGDQEIPQKYCIYLGRCQAALRAGIGTAGMPDNSFMIKTTDDAIFLIGVDGLGAPPGDDSTSMGSLFAVYEWLERQIGVLWLWPGELGTVVSRLNNIYSGEPSNIKILSSIVSTRLHFGGTRKEVLEYNIWMRRHRVVQPVSLHYGHAFTTYWKRFGKKHPEYFALGHNGKRSPATQRTGLVQMCVTNPDLHKQIITDWMLQRKRHKNLPWLNGIENDRTEKNSYCICAKCKAWDVKAAPLPHELLRSTNAPPQQSLSDRYARFWLSLQNAAQKYDSNAKVYGYAYSNYRNPPIKTKLNKNIIIGIVPNYMYPVSEQQKNVFRQQWDGWGKCGAKLILRPNYFLSGYCMPYIFAEEFGKDFKYAAKHGMMGAWFDMQAGMWGTQGPNLYMLVRLIEKPDMPTSKILSEYYSGFSPAKEEIKTYFKYWKNITLKITSKWRGTRGGGWSQLSCNGEDIYNPDAFTKGFDLLKKAKITAKNRNITLKRIQFLYKWLRHAQLAMDVLAARHIFNRARTTKNHNAFKAAKEKLDEFRKTSGIRLNEAFLKRLELWSGVRGGKELKEKRIPTQKILDALCNLDDSRWHTQIVHGICDFGVDEKENSPHSAYIHCGALDKNGKSWARYYTRLSLEDGMKYNLSFSIKTSFDFKGRILIWPPGSARLVVRPTKGKWKTSSVKFIADKSSLLYLNLSNGTGKVSFADIRLERLE